MKIVRNSLPREFGLRLVYCAENGRFLGEVIVDGARGYDLKCIANDLLRFAEAQIQQDSMRAIGMESPLEYIED